MLRKFLERHLPTPARVADQRSLGMFSKALAKPDLWHLNRRSVSTAAAVGLFLVYFPFPGQMFLAAWAAIRLRCNLPLSVVLVWISNPLTIAPMFFFAYKVGTWILGVPPTISRLSLSWEWLSTQASAIWLPMLVGALVCGLTLSALGFAAVQITWRWSVVQRWERRRTLRRLRQEPPWPATGLTDRGAPAPDRSAPPGPPDTAPRGP